jgi:hypothetical protein
VLFKRDYSRACGVKAKIIDFGLAQLLNDPTRSHVSNAAQGTPFYVSSGLAVAVPGTLDRT